MIDRRRAPLARVPRAVGPPHHDGGRTALVSVKRDSRDGDVERHQQHPDRRGVRFAVLYGVGWWAWRTDPHMLTILRESVRFKTRYDPAKWAAQPWYILITQARRQSHRS